MNDLDIAVCTMDEVMLAIRGYGTNWQGWAKLLRRVVAVRPDIGAACAQQWKGWRPAHAAQATVLASIGLTYDRGWGWNWRKP